MRLALLRPLLDTGVTAVVLTAAAAAAVKTAGPAAGFIPARLDVLALPWRENQRAVCVYPSPSVVFLTSRLSVRSVKSAATWSPPFGKPWLASWLLRRQVTRLLPLWNPLWSS